MLQTSGHLRFHLSNKNKPTIAHSVMSCFVIRNDFQQETNAKLYIREGVQPMDFIESIQDWFGIDME